MKFEIGKWYQIDSGSNMYFKYLKTLDHKIYYTENIIWNKYQVKKDYIGDGWVFKEVELSEISSFLPENHSDKFENQLKEQENILYSNAPYIEKYKAVQSLITICKELNKDSSKYVEDFELEVINMKNQLDLLKPEDFIGKWVKTPHNMWYENSYCLVTDVIQVNNHIEVFYSIGFGDNKILKNNLWIIHSLNKNLKIVSEAEVSKKAIEYGHDLGELGLHQFISISKTIKKEDLYNTKIWIGNDESLSKKVQERLFELGFEWGGTKDNIHHKHDTIYLHKPSTIMISNTSELFKKSKNKEITLSDLGLEETVIDCNEFYNQPIEIIPVIKTTDINIPNIILTNNKLTI